MRQLQHCVTERGATECVELFHIETKKGGAGGLCRTANKRIQAEAAYQRKAEAALQDENCFKIFFVRFTYLFNYFCVKPLDRRKILKLTLKIFP